MDCPTKGLKQVHQLEISPDWAYTRSRLKDGVMFSFHSSKTCPGYSIQVSNWRLCKVACDQSGHSDDIGDLILGAHHELKRLLGVTAGENMKRAHLAMRQGEDMQLAVSNLRKLVGQSQERLCEVERWEIWSRKAVKAKLINAALEDLMSSPRVALLSVLTTTS